MMKKFFLLLITIIFLIVAILYASAAPAIVAFTGPTLAKVSFMSAIVNTNKLNVRQGPSTLAPVVCTLRSGERVEVYGKIGNWYLVYLPGRRCAGMVSGNYITPESKMVPKPPTAKVTPRPAATPIPTRIPGVPAPTKAPATAKPTPAPAAGALTPTAEENELMGLVNAARKSAGAPALSFDSGLIKTARLKARDMVDKNYFSHQSPTYGSPFDMMRQFGISFKTAGENIAGNSSVKGAFDAWMKSEGHRKNILNPAFNYAGYGIVPSPVYGKVLVQQFIGR